MDIVLYWIMLLYYRKQWATKILYRKIWQRYLVTKITYLFQ